MWPIIDIHIYVILYCGFNAKEIASKCARFTDILRYALLAFPTNHCSVQVIPLWHFTRHRGARTPHTNTHTSLQSNK